MQHNHKLCGLREEIMKDKNKAFATFFYEQCAGTFAGHMANVANNPVLFGMISAASGKQDSCYAATKTEFAELLRTMADDLDS